MSETRILKAMKCLAQEGHVEASTAIIAQRARVPLKAALSILVHLRNEGRIVGAGRGKGWSLIAPPQIVAEEQRAKFLRIGKRLIASGHLAIMIRKYGPYLRDAFRHCDEQGYGNLAPSELADLAAMSPAALQRMLVLLQARRNPARAKRWWSLLQSAVRYHAPSMEAT